MDDQARAADAAPPILAIDHVGVRVRDAERALAFYNKLGFHIVYEDRSEPVLIVRNRDGIELNLIVNASPGEGSNVLLDMPDKHPGITHVALRVASMDETVSRLRTLGIAITEGPVALGPRNTSVFIRDPDDNVIELTERAST
ncbi:VOC family protein [Haliangium sp.]|uniref:VOC family protein n=1 Tax=Haliangium sp. TaxID=2663208 RepID=UPI003D0A0183